MSKLLIVDDSAALLKVMKNVLEHIGYTVSTLVNANDIYRKISEFQPDLLILDIHLGGVDGREICKELRKNVEFKQMGVLVFSVYPKTLEDYKSYKADDFMEKPFDIKILLEKISSILNLCRIRKKVYPLNSPLTASPKKYKGAKG